MAEDATAPLEDPPVKSAESDQDIIEEAKERFKLADEADSDQRQLRREDTKFALGDSDNMWQWSAQMLAQRQAEGKPPRPCITDNRLLGMLRQVTNDQRQNRPQLKARAVRDGSKDVAEIYDGIFRHIEDISDAASAYSCAGDHQTSGGLGYFRILTECVDCSSFDQEIKIQRIPNPDSVRIDPYCKQLDGSDMKWGFIFDLLPKEIYERQNGAPTGGWDAIASPAWVDMLGGVMVAEYFRVTEKQFRLCKMLTGEIIRNPDPAQWPSTLIIDERQAIERDVEWFKLSTFKVLKRRKFPSQFVPICRVIGEEWEVDGEKIIRGMTRVAKDPQRLVNYWTSTGAEMVALQPKAPYVGYSGQIDAHKALWDAANTDPVVFLPVDPIVDPVSGAILPLPQRQQPPMMPAAFMQGKLEAIDALKAATGKYDASLGQRSNETSGIAIRSREIQGDTSTYHFQDGLARGIRYAGRIILDMVPRVYRDRQATRIIGEDGADKIVRLTWKEDAPPVSHVKKSDGEGTQRVYNLNAGLYDVTADVGPGYQTKRQESADLMTKLAQADPTLMQQAGDIIVRKFDIPGADEIADRKKKFLPPQVLEGEGDESDPEQQIQALRGQVQQMSQALENANAIVDQLKEEADKVKLELAKLQTETFKVQSDAQNKLNAAQTERDKAALSGHLDAERLQFERDKAAAEAQLKAHELELRTREQELQNARAEMEVAIKRAELEIKTVDLEIRRIELENAEAGPDEAEGEGDGKPATKSKSKGPSRSDAALRHQLSTLTGRFEGLQATLQALGKQSPSLPPITIQTGGERRVVNLELVKGADGSTQGVRGVSEPEQGAQ